MEAMTLQSVTSPKDFRFAVYFDCFAQHRFQSLIVGVAAVASYVLLSLHFFGFSSFIQYHFALLHSRRSFYSSYDFFL